MAATNLSPIPLTEVGALRFGHWTDAAAGTGCTVIVAPHGATGAVDVRGGAPASRETDLLRPGEHRAGGARRLPGRIGLRPRGGLRRGRTRGARYRPRRGRDARAHRLLELHLRPRVWQRHGATGVDAGISATRAALDGDSDAPLAEGCVGAGTGATVGKLNGPDRATKSGLGARAFKLDGLRMGAIAVVNACGDIVDPATGRTVAGMRAAPDSLELADMEEAMLAAGAQMEMPLDRTNTTISCLVTNAHLTKAEATKVAQMAADAYAHVIRPTHTTNDGDTIYVLATGELEGPTPPLDLIGLVATRTLEAALVAGATEATALHDLPAARDLA